MNMIMACLHGTYIPEWETDENKAINNQGVTFCDNVYKENKQSDIK